MKHITSFLLRIESCSRNFFEQIPFIHGFLAGIGIVLFWRGVWHIADEIQLSSVASLIIGSILLGAIGLFLHTLVGNAIIIKNVEKDTTTSKKTEKELLEVEANIQQEELTLQTLQKELDKIHKKLDEVVIPK
jgi:hypothetical protein